MKCINTQLSKLFSLDYTATMDTLHTAYGYDNLYYMCKHIHVLVTL